MRARRGHETRRRDSHRLIDSEDRVGATTQPRSEDVGRPADLGTDRCLIPNLEAARSPRVPPTASVAWGGGIGHSIGLESLA